MANTLLSLNEATRTVNSGSNKVTLLDNIDLQVREGEFISLMGPLLSTFHRVCMSIILPLSITVRTSLPGA